MGETQPAIEDPSDGSEFERTRRLLLNSYHSDIQNHAGLIIAIIIGSLTLISRFDSFFSSSQKPVAGIVFWLIICIIFGVSLYVIVRIFYWTNFVNVLLGIKIADVETLFERYCKERNVPVDSNVPFPLKMQEAAYQRLLENKLEKTASLTIRISMMDRKSLFLTIVIISTIFFILLLVATIAL